MVWGGIGGLVGFLASLLGSLSGVVVALFVGLSCGKRAAVAEAGRRSGGLSGLIGGVVAAPVYVVAAAAGALVAARWIGTQRLASMLSEMLETEISAQEAWWFFLASLVVAAIFQVAVLVGASVAAGAWAERKR
jgi:hypothetical protein